MALSRQEGEWSINESENSLVVSICVQAASTAELEVDVAPDCVSVRDNQCTHKLDLPCTVLPDSCQVKFRKSKRELQLTLVRSPDDIKQNHVVDEPLQTEADDDDDDMPPPLEAARSVLPKPSSEDVAYDVQRAVDAAANLNLEDLADGDHTNEYASVLMNKALAAREQKRKETEDNRKKADLGSGGGLKKGFLSGGKKKGSLQQDQRTESSKSPAVSQSPAEEIPFITGAADPEAAKRESLKLPEVQRALEQGTKKLKEDQSWVTPQLLQALGSRPDISQAMSNPRIQEAMQLMQTDPEGAKKKYKDDVEVTKFLKEFTGLMATHFEVLGNEESKSSKPAPQRHNEPQKAIDAPITGLDLSKKPPPAMARPSSNGEKLPIDDPKVMAVMQDPEVQALIAAIRSGQPLELHQIARTNERLFMKVKVLLENGLLAMQH